MASTVEAIIVSWQCDKLCGDGVQRRDITCFRKVDGKIEKMADGDCPGDKPETEMPCKIRPCEGVDWVTTEWSGVSFVFSLHRSTAYWV